MKNLRRLFLYSPESDSISLEQAYTAFNRDLSKEQSNKNWITNLMTHLKWHNLILPTYGVNNGGKRVLKGLELTMEGKKGLGRIETPQKEFDAFGVMRTNFSEFKVEHELDNVSSILKAIAKLRENHPEFEIVFDMKLKGV